MRLTEMQKGANLKVDGDLETIAIVKGLVRREWFWRAVACFAVALLFLIFYKWWLDKALGMTEIELSSFHLAEADNDLLDKEKLASLVRLLCAPAFCFMLLLAVLESFKKVLKAVNGDIGCEGGLCAVIGVTLGFLCVFALMICAAVIVCLGLISSIDEAIILIAILF